MREIESPLDLVARLVELFPALAEEFEHDVDDEPIETYHQVIQTVVHRLPALLEDSHERTTGRFCDLINSMVLKGGHQENAISTCLLEHASQIRIRKILSPFLCAAAKRELR